ncbi:MAG: tyrosine-type recombinase/integrase, partial [Aggregatilineales bacterium]
MTVSLLTPITLVSYRNMLQQTETTNTVNTHVYALRNWCAWLVSEHYLESDPASRFRPVAHQARGAPQGLKQTEINALLRATSRSRYPERNTAILQLMLQTGIRIGECAALTWSDIVFSERHGQLTIRAGKGNKTRLVPLNGSARQAVATYVAPLLNVAPTL